MKVVPDDEWLNTVGILDVIDIHVQLYSIKTPGYHFNHNLFAVFVYLLNYS